MRFIIAILCSIIVCASSSYGFSCDDQDTVIVPGERAGRMNIGDKPGQTGQLKGVAIGTSESGIVDKITVSDPAYCVQYNRIRVGDDLEKIFRFYHEAAKSKKGENISIGDRRHGVAFTVNMKTEKIVEITVFPKEIPDYYKRAEPKDAGRNETENKKRSLRQFYKEQLK